MLIIIGPIVFVAGALVNYLGWTIHRRYPRLRGGSGSEPESLAAWFMNILKQFFPLLVGRDSSLGERLAAMGAIICAVGIMMTIVALLPIE